jgi:hypothetical protein
MHEIAVNHILLFNLVMIHYFPPDSIIVTRPKESNDKLGKLKLFEPLPIHLCAIQRKVFSIGVLMGHPLD